MEKTRVHHLQCLLQRGRDDLLSRLSHVGENSATSHDYGRDEADRAKSAEAQELLSRLSAQEREKLETIERACVAWAKVPSEYVSCAKRKLEQKDWKRCPGPCGAFTVSSESNAKAPEQARANDFHWGVNSSGRGRDMYARAVSFVAKGAGRRETVISREAAAQCFRE
jgi:RNA polymerase-binding transcription factor DksA